MKRTEARSLKFGDKEGVIFTTEYDDSDLICLAKVLKSATKVQELELTFKRSAKNHIKIL